ncbi:MAG: putative integral rane efflux protein [Actinomycetia bacterium]|nr:putative integral rane efflux protein [Actinomycetes bacterium]
MTDTTPDPRRWWTLIVLCVSLLVIGLDNTILNVALPTLVRDLDASTSQLQWIVDAYTLVFAGFLLTGGSLGDRFGRKHTMSLGLVVFAAASAAGAFADSATTLSLCRAVMGIGGALIMPATLSILTNVFTDPKERSKAIGAWAGISGLGIAVGPILGGFLLEHFWWGSVFLVNVPVAIVALVLGRFLIPNSKDPSAPKLDFVGSGTSIVGLSLLLWAIIEVPTKGWSDPNVILTMVGALLVLGTFATWELRTEEPMLDLQFFANPRFTVASLSITMAFFAMSGTLFLLSQLLQFVLGYDALSAGYRMAPIAVSMMIMAPLTPRLTERFGSKRMVAVGLTTSACGLLILATVTESSSYALVFVGLVVMALGIAMGMVPATDSIMGSLPKEKAGVGSAVNDTTRQVGGALGVAVLGSLLATGYRAHLKVDGLTGAALAQARASVGGALQVAKDTGNEAVAQAGRASYVHGMHLSLLVGAVFVLGGALLSLLYLPARATVAEQNPTELVPGDIVVSDEELELA